MTYRRLFWSLLLPISAASYYLVDRGVKAFAHAPDSATISAIVLSEQSISCAPEPKEQLTFVLALVLPVCLMALTVMLLRRLGVFERPLHSNPWIDIPAIGMQLGVMYVGAHELYTQVAVVFGYRFLDMVGLIYASACTALALAFAHLPIQWSASVRVIGKLLKRHQWVAWLFAFVWIVSFCASTVFRDAEVESLPATVRFHLPFTMGECAAVANGRTPLVDFFSQYQNLLSLLLAPLFRLLGVTIATFTGAMALLSLVGLILLFDATRRVCNNAWIALALFVPFMAIAFYPESVGSTAYDANAFNYYAVGPMRYFGLLLLAWVVAVYLERPGPVRVVFSAAAALLVALNNLDFGVPSAVGVLACVLLFPPSSMGRTLDRRIAKTGILFGLAALATLGMYLLVIRVAAGAWPMLSQLAQYQKTFALLGFFMMPIPEHGLHWVIYLCSVAAVLVPLFEAFACVREEMPQSRRLVNGSLAYAGIATTGPLAYFVGRSHHLVIIASFCAWGYMVILFAYRAWLDWKLIQSQPRSSGAHLVPIPALAVCTLLALQFPNLAYIPNLRQQWHRLTTHKTPQKDENAPLVAAIRKRVGVGGKAVICYHDGHVLAMRAGVENYFPFAHPGSLIIKEQLNAVMASLARLPAGREFFFGNASTELNARLEQNGYCQLETIEDFVVWGKSQCLAGVSDGHK